MMTNKRTSIAYSWLAGCNDAATGLGLIFVPAMTLELMGVDSGSCQLSLIRFIGAFVFGTGSLYLWAAGLLNLTGNWNGLRHAWLATVWLRSCVACVTTVLILNADLTVGWWPVPVTDGALAAFQVYWIISGRFPDE